MNRFAAGALALTALLIPAMIFAQTPLWVEQSNQGNLTSDSAYFGVGSADYKGQDPDHDSQLLSKNRALDDLSYQLSVSITSELKDNLSQKGKYSKEQVSSSLFVSTRKVLSGIKVQEKWNDRTAQRYWVMLSIDKDQAERQIQQQDFANEVVQRLEKNQVSIETGIKKLDSILKAHTEKNDTRMQHIQALFVRLDKKLDSFENSPQTGYEDFFKKVQYIEAQWQKKEDLSKNQATQLDLLIRQNQFLAQKLTQLSDSVREDHFLAMVEDDVQNQEINQTLEVTITPQRGAYATYVAGDTIRFVVTANRDCYVKVIYLSTIDRNHHNETRQNTLIFPNAHDKNNFIKAKQPILIGRYDELEVQPPFGKDVVTVVASPTQFNDIKELLQKSEGEYYAYTTNSIRGAVKARGIGAKKDAVTDTCFIISKAH
jgi:hypothetical protein